MRLIEIGLEVHKAIEADRRSLAESENAILMRLLKLAADKVDPSPTDPETSGLVWRKEGIELPDGTKLRAVYSGRTIVGEIQNGVWRVNGKLYHSPSMALMDNAVTKKGNKTHLNGWNLWQVRRPGDQQYIPLSLLRAHARKRI